MSQSLRQRLLTGRDDYLSLRWFVLLLTGRAAYRAEMALAAPFLAAVWPAEHFQAYADAMGRAIFVVPLLSSCVEKGLLRLIPRAPRARDEVLTLHLVLLAALCAVAAGWVGLTSTAGDHGTVYLLAGALGIFLGVNQVLVATQRALKVFHRDVANHVALAGFTAATLAAVPLLGLSPRGLLLSWCAAVLALDLMLAVMLRRMVPWSPRRRLARYVTVTAAYLGAGDIAAGLSITAVFWHLSRGGHARESAALYVAVSLAALVFNGATYVMRILQPSVAQRLGGRRLDLLAERHRLRAAACWVAAIAYCVGAATGARALDRAGWASVTVLMVGLMVSYVPVFLSVSSLHFLLENADSGSLRVTAGAALAGLVSVVLAGGVLIRLWGGFGALGALALGELVHLAVLLASGVLLGAPGAVAATPARGGAP